MQFETINSSASNLLRMTFILLKERRKEEGKCYEDIFEPQRPKIFVWSFTEKVLNI